MKEVLISTATLERTINKPQEITQESETDDFKWKNIWGKGR